MDGLVLSCDHDGRLRSLMTVGAGLPEFHSRGGSPFPMLFGLDAVGRALDLYTDLRRTGLVIDRPLESVLEHSGTLYVSGRHDDQGLVLTVARVPHAAGPMSEDLAQRNPALAARIEALGGARRVTTGVFADNSSIDALFDEMTRLNSELATAQRALSKSNAELAASNEQKNRLMGMMAHDLRSPLQVVAGFASILQDRLDGRLDGQERECLERIRESSLFMRHLVEDALSLAAVQAGRLRLSRRPTDLAALVRRNVSMNRVLADGKAIAIDLTLPDAPLPQIDADPAKLEQVLNNLLSNAIKYSDRGGRIRVALGTGPGTVRIAVADDGRGIPTLDMSQLFQPFARSGTLGTMGESTVGLGLYICRTIVEGHGGRIAVDSEPGRGAVFTVELPLAAVGG